MAKNLYKSSGRARKFLLAGLTMAIFLTGYDFISGFLASTDPLVVDEETRFYMFAQREFGEIPVPIIPGIDFERQGIEYRTTSVNPEMPDVSYVYRIAEPAQKLRALDNARPTVEELGFERSGDEQIEPNLYRWTGAGGSQEITYNTLLRQWDLSTDYANNEAAIARKNLNPDLSEYISNAGRIASRLGFEDFGLDNSVVEATFVSLGLNDVFVDQSISGDAEYVSLQMFKRIPQADLKPTTQQPELQDGQVKPVPTQGRVYSNDPRYGQVDMIVSNEVRTLSTDVFELNYTNYEYNQLERGTYLLSTPEEAWNNIANGQGSLVYLRPQGTNYFYIETNFSEINSFTVDFRQTELAFWEPNEYNEYAYPIYVFEGTAEVDGRIAEFTFFIDAIKRV